MTPTTHRPARRGPASIAALALAATLAAPAAGAAEFTALTQARSVEMAGQITLLDLDTQQAYSVSLAPSEHTQPGDFGLFDTSVGLSSLTLLDHPDLGEGYGAGRAAQTSSIAAQAIRFDGMADVFMSGQVNGPADLFASGSSTSRFDLGFSVALATPVTLSMNSELGATTSSNYQFSLTRASGAVVWDQTVLFDVDGNEVRSFTQQLTLDPGTYRLTARLAASSVFNNDNGTSGRALAQFSLLAVPVPEPGAAALLLAGLAGVGGALRRRRQPRADSGTSGA